MSTHAALKALSEPRRRELLEILKTRGSSSIGELTERVDVSQQAVSLHMKALEDAGLVEARKEGTRHIYAVRPEGFQPVTEFVAGFWTENLETLKDKFERDD
jgi:DNA-binding transcriptional ArsR family regulator